MTGPLLQIEIPWPGSLVDAAHQLRRDARPSALLDGSPDHLDRWTARLAVEPRLLLAHRVARDGSGRAALGRLERIVEARRARGGSPATGVLALLAYDLLDAEPAPERDDDGLPELVVLEVDASLELSAEGSLLLQGTGTDSAALAERVRRSLDGRRAEARDGGPVGPEGAPRTSLPERAYLDAVRQVKGHIARGDIYQANLCQRFELPYRRDPWDLYRRLRQASPAPRAAYFEAAGFALASVSPETFLRVAPGGEVETLPIKGTRPRGGSPEEDRALAAELAASPKDRAELVMIVDLERNDLGRVSETGSIRVDPLAEVRSYPAVHHLVARVRGRLLPGVGAETLLSATFPGGSITGAPKRRAMQILRGIEPVRRGFFTGSLVWFGDDGSLDSSLLIRSVVLARGRACLGAGGGVVADSDPEAEWHESNHKARAAARVLGFEPEEAS